MALLQIIIYVENEICENEICENEICENEIKSIITNNINSINIKIY